MKWEEKTAAKMHLRPCLQIVSCDDPNFLLQIMKEFSLKLAES